MSTPIEGFERLSQPSQNNELDEDEEEDEDFKPRLISRQSGATIIEIDRRVVRKRGYRITRNEEAALRLVEEHTTVPVPHIVLAHYFPKNGREWGSIIMELVDGFPLHHLWGTFADDRKERICLNIWDIVKQLRQIIRPAAYAHLYQCGADGSPSIDVLIKDLKEPQTPIQNDEALRARIYERYLHCNGGSYPEHLPTLLPQSSVSVFTHGDLAPRNIMVNEDGQITGILDWENAGWYPDYWEYANILKPSEDEDWMGWMDRTKPITWNIQGIVKARRVLF